MKIYDSSTTTTTSPTEVENLKVGIAEYEVTTDSVDLTTSGLGSCVGVAIYDPDAGISGLVHVMLPESEEMADGNAAKFADTGTELLVEEMLEAGATMEALEAKIAGGSDMLDFSESGMGIGERNVHIVREILDEFNIPLVGEDVGGDHGRSLRLESETGDLVVKSANEEQQRL